MTVKVDEGKAQCRWRTLEGGRGGVGRTMGKGRADDQGGVEAEQGEVRWTTGVGRMMGGWDGRPGGGWGGVERSKAVEGEVGRTRGLGRSREG